jgi:hypothetical protein
MHLHIKSKKAPKVTSARPFEQTLTGFMQLPAATYLIACWFTKGQCF